MTQFIDAFANDPLGIGLLCLAFAGLVAGVALLLVKGVERARSNRGWDNDEGW